MTELIEFPDSERFETERNAFFQRAKEAGLDTDPENAWNAAAYFYTQAVCFHESPETFQRPRVGLCFYGPCGAGKTVVAEFLREQIKALRWRVQKIQTAPLIDKYRRDELLADEMQGTPKEDILLDDIGYEEDARRFGDRWGIADFLKFRYEYAFLRHGRCTIATTNLNGIEEIRERYGVQIASRAAEMFYFILVARKDRRREIAERRAAEIERRIGKAGGKPRETCV